MIDPDTRSEPASGFLAVLVSAFWSVRYAFVRPTETPEPASFPSAPTKPDAARNPATADAREDAAA